MDLTKHEDGNYNSCSFQAEAVASGIVHCVVMWWTVALDEEGDITLSMVPRCFSQQPDEVKVISSMPGFHTKLLMGKHPRAF